MSPSASSYLRHILDEIRFLLESEKELTKDVFLSDETKKRAFVRSLEIIGEAAKNLPEDVRSANPDIEWKAIAGMRDRLIHGYFGVDYEIVWDVVVSKLPALRDEVDRLLSAGND